MSETEVKADEKKTEETESPGKKSQSLDADAFHNFLQGKRHLLVQDYAHAVDSLADACELYVKHYGETAVECGEVYYHYGLALFRLFQQQAGILGDALPDGSEEEDEEEEEEKSDSEEDKEKENADNNSVENGEVAEEEADEESLEDEDEDAKKEVGADEKAEVKQSEKAEVKQSEKAEVKQSEKAEVKQSEKAEVKQSEKAEVKQSEKAEVKQSEKAEVKQSEKAEEVKRSEKAEEVKRSEKAEEVKRSEKAEDFQVAANNVSEEKMDSTLTNDNEVSSSTEKPTPDSKIEADSSTTEATVVSPKVDEQGPSCSTDLNEAGPSTSQPKTKTEEISDLQLAWETLETAKSIFKRQDSRESQLKVANILIILAEISMECENYVSAVDDLQECLDIRQLFLEPDDRSIAETYYQLALAYTYDSQVNPAIENYEKTLDVIQLRINNLKNQTEVKQNPDGFDIDPQVEIDELEDLLPEVKAKMDDTKDMMQDARKIVKEMAFENIDEVSSGSTTTEKPVSNIGHLLKRKKPGDSEVTESNDVKKIKLVSSENGSGQPSEVTNAESVPKA